VSINEAAAFGNIEAVKQHLAADADVNAKRFGWTPLCEATINGHKEIAELLIAADADVNATDNRGSTPLDWAIKQKHAEIADLLRKHGGKTEDWFKAGESIHIAAKAGHIEAVKKHLAADVDVDLKANDSWTPLQNAAWYGQEEIAELLVAEGADVNAKDYDGKTPLDLAKRHPEIADLLRKHGGKTGEELKAEGK
jgi:ankyrin repeat protein